MKQSGLVICKEGGLECLEEHIAFNTPTKYSIDYNNVTQNYLIYKSGTLMNYNGDILCLYGGKDCLSNVISKFLTFTMVYENVTRELDGSTYYF